MASASTFSSRQQQEEAGSPQVDSPNAGESSPQVALVSILQSTAVDPEAFHALQNQVNVLQQSQVSSLENAVQREGRDATTS